MEIFGFTLPLWLLLVVLGLIGFYLHATSTFKTFEKMNVPGPKPWPIVGTMMLFFKYGLYETNIILYKTYGKVVGTFIGRRPFLVLYDPEMLKQVMVKEFSKFRNRYPMNVKEYPTAKMLSLLDDEHWKHVRNHLTPTFSGRKLRRMVDLINNCCDTMVHNLQEPVRAGDMFECKEYTTSYALDVIASTAFSIDIDAKKDKKNKFVQMVNKLLENNIFRLSTIIAVFIPSLVPHFKKLGLSMIPKDVVQFFVDAVNKTIKDREDNPDQSPKDFLQLMMSSQVDDLTTEDAEKDETHQTMVGTSGVWTKSGLTHEEILAQSLVFFFAGFSTNAATISFTMYNLATNPSCQDRVYQEIMDVVGDKVPNYDDMKKMSYLEMCIEETLRQYPPAPASDRLASEDADVGGLHVPAGITVGIPIYTLQNDPEVWPDPDRFIPERFTQEEKEKRHPFQYMPFGMGPRNCVGMRLALLEMKMALVHILRNFRLLPSEKTEVPLKLHKFKVEAENGLWIKAEPRNSS